MKEFDEDEAVAAMRRVLTADGSSENDDNVLFEILDLIYDAYDELDMLDPDSDADEDTELEETSRYVEKYLRKSGNVMSYAMIKALVAAEMDYEQSLV